MGSSVVYIVHLFTVCGGGERLSLEIARALSERGLHVIYVTNSKNALDRCSELFSLKGDYDVIEVKSILEKILGLTGRLVRYRRLLLLSRALRKLRSIGAIDLIIDTASNYPSNVSITYIHYPVVLGTVDSTRLHWRIYNWLVKKATEGIMGEPRLALVNSKWTAEIVREVYGLNPVVLYPPVDVEYYAYDGRRKEKTIVTVSRISPEKKLHLLPRIASMLSDYEWNLVGSMGHGVEKYASSRVLGKIKREVEKYNARNFHIHTNLPRRELRELLLSASFYVHPFFVEHFGIAVVEAMSAGVIPVVYKDGGVWTDIVSPVDDKLGYTNIEEIPLLIRNLEEDLVRIEALRKKSMEKTHEFRSEVFRRKLIEILESSNLI